mgnify:CR=1 FL=1
MKKAIVTGVGGQDGYYMAQLLSEKGYEVLGLTHKAEQTSDLSDNVRIVEFDIRNYDGLYKLIEREKPEEIYNFAAQSSSIYSWDDSRGTFELNFMAPVAILESIRDHIPSCRFFQASSAEVFGRDPVETPQTEQTMRQPVTPYAIAKNAVDEMVDAFRDKYGIFAVSKFLD